MSRVVAIRGDAARPAHLRGLRGLWPRQTGNPYTEVLDAMLKHVVSTPLREPLPWRNSSLLAGDDAVAALREQPGGDLAPRVRWWSSTVRSRSPRTRRGGRLAYDAAIARTENAAERAFLERRRGSL